MAIQNAIDGKKTGKIGGQVFSVVNGQQVVREYRAKIANPNTELQVQSRAKLKLMSQLAAVVSPIIAIKREGNKSGRNIFISDNYDLATFADAEAKINLNKIQLTKGVIGIGEFTADRTGGTSIECSLNENLAGELDRVMYVAMVKEADGSLHLHDSKVSDVAGANGQFVETLRYTSKPVVIYAYGMRDNTEKAKAKFGNMNAPTAEMVARILSSRVLSSYDVTMTDTKGLTMLAGENEKSSDDIENILVNVTISGNGSATGAGRYPIGQQVTLRATPDAEAEFVAWKRGSASGETLSTNANYTFVAEESIAIVAVFRGGPVPHYTIAASASPAGYGSVTGAGSYEEGASVTLHATPAEGKRFLRWTENGASVSTSANYTFVASANRTLVAVFDDAPASGFSNVKIDGTNWHMNRGVGTSTPNVQGDYSGEATHAFTCIGSQQPSVGAQKVTAYSTAIQQDAFSFQGYIPDGDTAWLCVGTPVSGQENTFVIAEVYPYSASYSMD